MAIKQYLGDGVYADRRGDDIVLTTENGVETTNTIVLEREVYEALVAWVAWSAAEAQRQGQGRE